MEEPLEDELLSLALLLKEKWVQCHASGLNGLVTPDDCDNTRFDKVIASLWEKRGAPEERHTELSSCEVVDPSALVTAVNAYTCSFQ